MVSRCQFYIKHKNRGCNAPVKSGFPFCGNHLASATETGERVPCPHDSTHHVLKAELEAHKAKCPTLRLQEALKGQPYCVEDCNAGKAQPAQLSSPGALCPGGCDTQTKQVADAQWLSGKGKRSQARAQHVRLLGLEGLQQIIKKVKTAIDEVCPLPEAVQDIRPPQCEELLEPDHVNPFSLRHAMQQASIIGNMHSFGLLEGAESTVFVEFGAGKGYLSCMLSKCSSAQQIVLVDNQSFRNKAERALRKLVAVERKRLDIKDFYPQGLPQLQAAGARWAALGKHLCGPASDFTLRSCVNAAAGRQEQSKPCRDADPACPCTAADTAAGPASQLPIAAGSLRGLAVATCCHHRCSWEHYVGKEMFAALGFTPEEFEVVSWMTGWALCGHEAPAGTATEAENGEKAVVSADQPRKSSKKRREAVARERATTILRQQRLQTPAAGEGACEGVELDLESRLRNGSQGELVPEPIITAAAGQAVGDIAADTSSQEQYSLHSPAASIPRDAKIEIGQACKRLIDHGRLLYLRQHDFRAESVLYVPAAISGENRLLLAHAGLGNP